MDISQEGSFTVFSRAAAFARKVHYRLLQAPRGRGKVFTAEECDEKYKQGSWDFLETIHELANFSVVIGYVRYFNKTLNKTAPRILDIGCGTGHFAELLGTDTFGRYVGLDLAGEAVRRAQERKLPNTEFCVGDFTAWETAEKFDYVISTGSICYADDPAAVIKKYESMLADNGLIIIALWRYGFNGVIWKKIENVLNVVDASVVTNAQGQIWDVKVFRSK